MALAIVAAAVGGLLVGSFLNVLVSRVPKRESPFGGRSKCPSCGATIRARDNIPLISWLLLRGRCRDCGASISARYPLVEAGTAVLYGVTVAVHYDDTTLLVLGLILVTFLIPIAAIDLELQLIPNRLTLPAAIIAVVVGTAIDPDGEIERLIAGAAAALFLGLPALINPRGMGMGDAKLAGVMGLYLGAPVGPALLIGLATGVVVGIGVVASQGMSAGRRTRIPFGPFLAFGAVVAMLVGQGMVDWYVDTF
ncbi:MAG: prepilin peptidase [Solirubrobacteraceae bacterium]|nr:prepilin peptidase [Solirubrobacteraceae bacterium]